MTRIRFEDLPSTNTPRNAENLNKLNNVVISSTEPTTGEEVWIQKGKNLLDLFKCNISKNASNYNINNSNNIVVTSTGGWGYAQIDNYKVKINKEYTLSAKFTNSENVNNGIIIYDSNGQTINFQSKTENSGELEIKFTPTTEYINIKFAANNTGDNNTNTVNYFDIQLELGSKTTYEPYINKKIYTKNDNGVYEEFYNDISGINEKGHFTKRADGTLIQRGKYITPLIAPTSGHTQIVNLPINFIDNDYNVVTQKMSGGSIGFATVEEGVLVIDNSRFDVTSWNFDVGGNAEPLTIGWVATGKWK